MHNLCKMKKYEWYNLNRMWNYQDNVKKYKHKAINTAANTATIS